MLPVVTRMYPRVPNVSGMILKLNFIIIGYNNHKSSQKLESYESMENERRSLNEEKLGSGSSILQQVRYIGEAVRSILDTMEFTDRENIPGIWFLLISQKRLTP